MFVIFYVFFFFFFFNDTATTEIYTLSLHDALPILHWSTVLRLKSCALDKERRQHQRDGAQQLDEHVQRRPRDRKSTRLNSSHLVISYAVFCLKKKKKVYIKSLQVPTKMTHYRMHSP